jgi:type VI secretion system protein VasG
MLGSIVRLQLNRIVKRVKENHKIPLTYGEDVVKLIISRCTELESGGRMIDAIVTNTMLPRISLEYLNRLAQGTPLNGIAIGTENADFSYAFS